MNELGNGLLVAFGIGLLIFVHELGHFLAARWIGVRVEVFSLGFGPRLLGFRYGGTDYRISAIPLGGYVAVAGQDPLDDRYSPDQSLHEKSPGGRMLFFAGGVIMNLLFALIAFPIAFHWGVAFPSPEIGRVEFGSGAWEAGLQRGDQVLAVNGKQTYSFENVVVEIALGGNTTVPLLVKSGDTERLVDVRPQFRLVEGLFMIGVEAADEDHAPELAVRGRGNAERAGLKNRDILLAIDGLPTTGKDRLDAYARLSLQPPKAVVVQVRRGTEQLEFTIEPETLAETATPRIGVQPFHRLVAGIRPSLAAIADLGIEHGDAILAIDGQAFRGPDLSVIATRSGDLEVVVRRNGEVRSLRTKISDQDRLALQSHIALTEDPDRLALQPMPDSAVGLAGMQPGDRLLAIDGQPVADWTELRALVRKRSQQSMVLLFERQPDIWGQPLQQVSFVVKPLIRAEHDYGFIPQLLHKRAVVQAKDAFDAVRLGCVCSLDLVKQLYITLKRLLTGDVAAKNLGGIIQISRVTYRHAQDGWTRFLYFLALLSINLAFVNILPIPMLDGGHMLFVLIERIKGSPVSIQVLNYSQIIGLVLVLALVVFVTYNDILRLL
ncbi:hypothetical protein LBMAG49_11880 [Planctomycetota bacterium]|nr:hypothetical protein LBMAG49_11880 [Planctomycetota bacterium]